MPEGCCKAFRPARIHARRTHAPGKDQGSSEPCSWGKHFPRVTFEYGPSFVKDSTHLAWSMESFHYRATLAMLTAILHRPFASATEGSSNARTYRRPWPLRIRTQSQGYSGRS